jgi:hypothetical protein
MADHASDWMRDMPLSDPHRLLAWAGRWRQEAASPRGGNWRDLYLTLAAECEHRATRISTESEWGSESTD